MTKMKTRPWDVTEQLETEEDMATYLEAALAEGNPALVSAALGDRGSFLKTPLSGDCLFVLDCLYSVRLSISEYNHFTLRLMERTG